MPKLSGARIRCDRFGCIEDYPLNHPELGEPGFAPGRWLWWVYLDLNRPDLFPRVLRFCAARCLAEWLDLVNVHCERLYPTPLDVAMRDGNNQIARKNALRWIRENTSQELG